MNKKLIIGLGITALGICTISYLIYKPKKDRKDLIKFFVQKNYTSLSEQLTQKELEKLEDAIFNLTDKEQKTLLNAYKGKVVNMDEISRILDKLHPVMDAIKPAFDIKRIELGKKEITLYIKNAITPNLVLNYGVSPIKMDVPLVTAPKDGQALMTLRFNKGKLTAFEGNKKIQEEVIIEKPILINNKRA